MASNIEMYYKNSENEYEALFPNSYSNYILASQSLITLANLSDGAIIDQAFSYLKSYTASASTTATSAYALANNLNKIAGKIQTGSYSGNGQSTASLSVNSGTIQMVFIFGRDPSGFNDYGSRFIAIRSSSTAYYDRNGGVSSMSVSFSGNNFYMYSNDFNSNSRTYYYCLFYN